MDKWCVTDGVVVDRDVHVIDNGHLSPFHRRMDGQTDGRTDGWTESVRQVKAHVFLLRVWSRYLMSVLQTRASMILYEGSVASQVSIVT